jgi:hypothetical protein
MSANPSLHGPAHGARALGVGTVLYDNVVAVFQASGRLPTFFLHGRDIARRRGADVGEQSMLTMRPPNAAFESSERR